MVQTALYDPIVVEPKLTVEKIEELVERGAESAKLDYKQIYDPSDRTHKVRLVKHVMAMANTAGGYIVIGIADNGDCHGLADADAEKLDEAPIRAQVSGYTLAQIPLFVDNNVRHEGQRYAVITVLPVIQTIVVAHADGNTDTSQLFRKGDVLVRHGTASERWNQADAEFLLQRVTDSRKEKWINEFSADLRALLVPSGRSAVPNIDEKVFDLPIHEFGSLVLGLLRGGHG